MQSTFPFLVKAHALMHMARDCYRKGSPSLWACWLDESLNQNLKRIAASAHRAVWHARVLETSNLFLARKEKKRKS